MGVQCRRFQVPLLVGYLTWLPTERSIWNIDFLIIHVGSNNIAIHQSVNQIISFYGDLIHYIKWKTSAQIVFTSILPRLCDFHQTERMVTKVNVELKSLCKRRHISFSNIYRSFLYKNKPDPSLFAPKDHLHLNFSGTALLRKKLFINSGVASIEAMRQLPY